LEQLAHKNGSIAIIIEQVIKDQQTFTMYGINKIIEDPFILFNCS